MRHRGEVAAGILAHARRLRWSASQIESERQRALRALLEFAVGHSLFHADRLAGIDLAEFTEAQLPSLPVMTKKQMMAGFDEVVIDRRLTIDVITRHLASVDDGGDDYLFDRYRVIASSGSSGIQGWYIYDWHEWTDARVDGLQVQAGHGRWEPTTARVSNREPSGQRCDHPVERHELLPCPAGRLLHPPADEHGGARTGRCVECRPADGRAGLSICARPADPRSHQQSAPHRTALRGIRWRTAHRADPC